MKNVWRLIAIGVAVYLLVLAVTFPANRLVPALESRVEGLDLQAADGTLVAGRAARLVWQGRDLGAASWQLQPLRLLLGAVEYRLEFRHPEAQGSTRLGVTLTGRRYGRELELQLQPETVISSFSPLPVSAGGEVVVHLERFEPGDRVPAGVQGTLGWRAASINDPVEIALGDIEFSLNSVDDELVAAVTQGGSLEAAGEIVVTAAGRYRVDLLLKPGTAVSDDVKSMLETVAQSQPGGKLRLTAAGSL